METGSCGCGGSEPELEYYQPLADVLSVLSKKYALETISIIDAHGPMRFKTLQEHLTDASSKTLSDRLDQLANEGLITRTQYEEIPPRVEYELTKQGRNLQRHLEPLLEWEVARQ
jgi:DNA-binding HxlR family transcriptional regulator